MNTKSFRTHINTHIYTQTKLKKKRRENTEDKKSQYNHKGNTHKHVPYWVVWVKLIINLKKSNKKGKRKKWYVKGETDVLLLFFFFSSSDYLDLMRFLSLIKRPPHVNTQPPTNKKKKKVLRDSPSRRILSTQHRRLPLGNLKHF